MDGVTDRSVTLTEDTLRAIQAQLRELELDGWLLYDFQGTNPISGGLLGLPALTRRYFVLIPVAGRPIALTHMIEQQPWRGWIGENRVYLGWRSLERELARLLGDRQRIALEHSPESAVPYLDRVPAGVLELIARSGVEVHSSGELVSAVYSRWGKAGEESHHRAARVLRETAQGAFDRIGAELRHGKPPTEWGVRAWIVETLVAGGLGTGADAIVATNANAANPHYAPGPENHASIRAGDLILIDLWGKENEGAIYADQTWMAYVGDSVPARIEMIWSAVRDARDAAVDFLRARFTAGEPVSGYEVDDVARRLIAGRGFGDAFIHRTGHSIDRDLHGSGPNIDNLESRDPRRLIPGIGFSIEPGVYLPGEIGIRSEIDVHMTTDGPRVTTPEPQSSIYLIRA